MKALNSYLIAVERIKEAECRPYDIETRAYL